MGQRNHRRVVRQAHQDHSASDEAVDEGRGDTRLASLHRSDRKCLCELRGSWAEAELDAQGMLK